MISRLCIAAAAALTFAACDPSGHSGPPSARATQIAVSWVSCALTDSGSVRCWGENDNGELGADTSSTTFNRTNWPVEVSGLSGATAIAAGMAFNCALTQGGQVQCWGANAVGQLGSGVDVVDSTSLADSTKPSTVSGLSGVSTIALGDSHACALTTAGAVKCWGDGSAGQLGDGVDLMNASGHFSTKPLTVPLTGTALDLSARGDRTCVVTDAHAVQCWGRDASSPTAVAGLETGVAHVYVGASRGTGPQFVCAITDAGEAKCLGTVADDDPVLGRGSDTSMSAGTAVTVSGLGSGVTSMGLGDGVACAIANGAVKCWGQSDGDQVLGAGEMLSFSSVPVTLSKLESGATSVSIGSCNACAVAGGKAYCWGRKGCVGDGTDDFSTTETDDTPTPVTSLP